MAIDRHFNDELNFLYARVHDEVSKEELDEHIEYINEKINELEEFHVLLDCADLEKALFCGEDLYNAANSINEAHRATLAIVVDKSDLITLGMARVLQMLSEKQHREVRLFDELRIALDWLLCTEAVDIDELEQYVLSLKQHA